MKTFIRIALLLLAFTAVSCQSAAESDGMYSSQIDQADVIFVGRVDYISATNVDAQQQIAFTVQEVLSDSINVGSGVVLTMDDKLFFEDAGLVTAVPSSDLIVGDEIIVFANQDIITSDSGQTAVLSPISTDSGAFVTLEARDRILSQVAQ